MRRNSTPSIVPESGDQDAYLLMDDLGRLGGCGQRRMEKRLTWKPSSPTCLQANIAAQFAWSPLRAVVGRRFGRCNAITIYDLLERYETPDRRQLTFGLI